MRLAFPWRVTFSHQKTFLNSVTSLISRLYWSDFSNLFPMCARRLAKSSSASRSNAARRVTSVYSERM